MGMVQSIQSLALGIMANGQPLRVPHDGSPAMFVALRAEHHVIRADAEVVRAVCSSEAKGEGIFYKMTELGEPPIGQRVRGEGWRNGLRELGWDNASDWYVCMQ